MRFRLFKNQKSKLNLYLMGVFIAILFMGEFQSLSAEMELPRKKSKYQRSKLTNDESEALADRRRLLLTTGEDKAVDLDFEANAGASGISYGNPQVLTTT